MYASASCRGLENAAGETLRMREGGEGGFTAKAVVSRLEKIGLAGVLTDRHDICGDHNTLEEDADGTGAAASGTRLGSTKMLLASTGLPGGQLPRVLRPAQLAQEPSMQPQQLDGGSAMFEV